MRAGRFSTVFVLFGACVLFLVLAVPLSFAAAPTVSSFSPTSGTIGTKVTINGSAFTGATGVAFNGAAATFTVNSDTKITATVPSAPIGQAKWRVKTSGGTATSAASFNVTG